MPPKKINPMGESGFIGEKKSNSKPKPYVELESITQYRYDRDSVLLADLFVCEETKLLILDKRK